MRTKLTSTHGGFICNGEGHSPDLFGSSGQRLSQSVLKPRPPFFFLQNPPIVCAPMLNQRTYRPKGGSSKIRKVGRTVIHRNIVGARKGTLGKISSVLAQLPNPVIKFHTAGPWRVILVYSIMVSLHPIVGRDSHHASQFRTCTACVPIQILLDYLIGLR